MLPRRHSKGRGSAYRNDTLMNVEAWLKTLRTEVTGVVWLGRLVDAQISYDTGSGRRRAPPVRPFRALQPPERPAERAIPPAPGPSRVGPGRAAQRGRGRSACSQPPKRLALGVKTAHAVEEPFERFAVSRFERVLQVGKGLIGKLFGIVTFHKASP